MLFVGCLLLLMLVCLEFVWLVLGLIVLVVVGCWLLLSDGVGWYCRRMRVVVGCCLSCCRFTSLLLVGVVGHVYRCWSLFVVVVGCCYWLIIVDCSWLLFVGWLCWRLLSLFVCGVVVFVFVFGVGGCLLLRLMMLVVSWCARWLLLFAGC